jgi:hypothetical protein
MWDVVDADIQKDNHTNISSGWSGTLLYLRHKNYTNTDIQMIVAHVGGSHNIINLKGS